MVCTDWTSEPWPVSVMAKQPGQREVHDAGQEARVLLGVAERLDRAAEQAPLHPALDLQRQVGEGEHLEGDDRGADVPAPADGGGEAVHRVAVVGQAPQHLPDRRAVALDVEAGVHAQLGEVGPVADLVAHGVPAPVEGALDGGDGGRGDVVGGDTAGRATHGVPPGERFVIRVCPVRTRTTPQRASRCARDPTRRGPPAARPVPRARGRGGWPATGRPRRGPCPTRAWPHVRAGEGSRF